MKPVQALMISMYNGKMLYNQPHEEKLPVLVTDDSKSINVFRFEVPNSAQTDFIVSFRYTDTGSFIQSLTLTIDRESLISASGQRLNKY